MSLKRKALAFFVISFMVFSALFVTSDSYAYWMGGLAGANEQADGTVSAGQWNQPFQWDPNRTYSIGDLVINNGTIYEAKVNNPNREPGVTGGWRSQWDVFGETSDPDPDPEPDPDPDPDPDPEPDPPLWDANTTYSNGDIVQHNGNIYQAKRNNPTREPGVDGGWNRDWDQIG